MLTEDWIVALAVAVGVYLEHIDDDTSGKVKPSYEEVSAMSKAQRTNLCATFRVTGLGKISGERGLEKMAEALRLRFREADMTEYATDLKALCVMHGLSCGGNKKDKVDLLNAHKASSDKEIDALEVADLAAAWDQAGVDVPKTNIDLRKALELRGRVSLGKKIVLQRRLLQAIKDDARKPPVDDKTGKGPETSKRVSQT